MNADEKRETAFGKAMKGASWLAADKFVSMAASLFVAIPMARHLGPADYGLLSLAVSFVAIIMPIAALGLHEMVTRELVEQPERRASIMGTVLAMRKIFAVLAIGLFGLYCLYGPFPDDRTRLYAFAMVGLAIAGDASVFRNWFVANHALRDYAIANVVKTLIFAAIRLWFIFAGLGLEAFVWLQAAEFGTTGLAAIIAYKFNRLPKEGLEFRRDLVGFFLRRSWPLLLASAAAVINLKIDIILLANMAGAHEAGIYAAAARISEVWYVIPNLLLTSAFPGLMMVRAKGKAEYHRFLQTGLDLLVAVSMAIAVVMTIIGPYAIPLLFGVQFAAASAILTVHVWSGVFVFIRALISKWLIAEELYRYSLISQLTAAIANIAFNLWLIPLYGAMGAALATLISYSLSAIGTLVILKQTRPMFRMAIKSLFWFVRARRLTTYLIGKYRGG